MKGRPEKNPHQIVRRIGREAGIPNLAELLAERIAPTDLQSLLIQVYKKLAERRKPRTLLSAYSTNKIARASSCNPHLLTQWDQLAFSHLPQGFQAIELSPVCPLGSVSSLAPVSQDWVLTTIRNTEVVADPTNALALEAALRRQKLAQAKPADATPVCLACSHRALRVQRYEDPNALQHFRLFSLCSAGRDTGSLRFEVDAITDHVRFYLESLTDYLGQQVLLKVTFNDLAGSSSLSKFLHEIGEGLRKEFKQARFDFEGSGPFSKGYYRSFRFHVHAAQNDEWVELVDGGDTDWTQKLLNNAKERSVTSAIGSERVCQKFGNLTDGAELFRDSGHGEDSEC